ncbi:MAG: ATP-binding protein [Caldilineaceae bacterium]
MRNPLGAVRNAVYYIQRYLMSDNQELQEFLQMIDGEVTTADRIITNLLEMTRSKEPEIQQLNFGEIVHEIWRQTKQNSTVNFHCRVAQDPFWVFADPTQLCQVVGNLMTNAVQAMPMGGELYVTGEYQNNSTVITVQDTGPGVPPDLRGQIFEPLFTTKAKGTGLGLVLCQQIIKRHGGTIEVVDSERGARFVIHLPHVLHYHTTVSKNSDSPKFKVV